MTRLAPSSDVAAGPSAPRRRIVHQRLLVRVQRRPSEQIRPAAPRPPQRLTPAPPRDTRVVARQQHRAAPAQPRNSSGRVYCGGSSRPLANDSRSGCAFAAQRARQEPRDRVGDHQGRQLAARQHVVADRQLLVRDVLAHALVHALVAAGQEDRGAPPASSRATACVKRRPAGSMQDHARARRPERLHARRTAAPA